MIFNGSTLERWGATAGILPGPQRLIHADPILAQPLKPLVQHQGCSKATSDMLRPWAVHSVLTLWKTRCDCLPTIRMSQTRMKSISKHFGEQEKQGLLLLNKISRWLLNWALKNLDYKFWHNSNRYSVLLHGCREISGNVKVV